MNRSVPMYYKKLISSYSAKESENKEAEVSFLMENSPKMNEGKFGLSVSVILCGRTWAVPQQRT